VAPPYGGLAATVGGSPAAGSGDGAGDSPVATPSAGVVGSSGGIWPTLIDEKING